MQVQTKFYTCTHFNILDVSRKQRRFASLGQRIYSIKIHSTYSKGQKAPKALLLNKKYECSKAIEFLQAIDEVCFYFLTGVPQKCVLFFSLLVHAHRCVEPVASLIIKLSPQRSTENICVLAGSISLFFICTWVNGSLLVITHWH